MDMEGTPMSYYIPQYNLRLWCTSGLAGHECAVVVICVFSHLCCLRLDYMYYFGNVYKGQNQPQNTTIGCHISV